MCQKFKTAQVPKMWLCIEERVLHLRSMGMWCAVLPLAAELMRSCPLDTDSHDAKCNTKGRHCASESKAQRRAAVLYANL